MSFSSNASSHVFGRKPQIMGVVNVTPDSFSGDAQFLNVNRAIERGISLVSQGATILDVGGESTRPGAEAVDIEDEIARVVPVIEGLRGHVPWLSIDTRNARTMVAALEAGATAINDISALTHDSKSLSVVSRAQVPVFLMHMQGAPRDMQEKPFYNNVVSDVLSYLGERIQVCRTSRIDTDLIVCDPGIGFGKTLEHNMLLLRNISKFQGLEVPILLGASRKSFIADLSEGEGANERLSGSLSAALWGLSQGVQIFRVHDVKETRQAFKVHQAIMGTDDSLCVE